MTGLVHDLVDLRSALGTQDLVEIDGAEQLEARIDDEDLAEPLGKIVVLAHVVDRLADRPERRHRDELRLHAAPGALFGVVERASQPDAFGERQLCQDFVLVLLVEVLEDVDRVVGIQFLHGPRDYEFWFDAPLDGERLAITMHLDTPAGERIFNASLAGTRRPLSDRTLAAAAVRYPLMTAQVIGLIHLEAMKLRLAGVPYRRPGPDHRPLDE